MSFILTKITWLLWLISLCQINSYSSIKTRFLSVLTTKLYTENVSNMFYKIITDNDRSLNSERRYLQVQIPLLAYSVICTCKGNNFVSETICVNNKTIGMNFSPSLLVTIENRVNQFRYILQYYEIDYSI